MELLKLIDPFGKRKRPTRNCEKKTEAVAWLRETQSQIDTGVGIESHGTTVGRYLTQWLEDEIRPERSENTYVSYESIIRLYLVPHLGRFTMQSIRPAHIQAMLAELERSDVGDRTRELCYVVLHACFSRAVRWRDLANNPCSAVQRPRKPQKKEMKPFTADEARNVLDEAKKTEWHALIALALSTGMRQGELFGLSPDDVDRKAKTVSIRRQAIEPKGIPHLADLKTRRSRRTLDLTATTLDAIVAHLASRMKRGLAGAETLFCSEAGTILSKTNFRRRVWLPLLKR